MTVDDDLDKLHSKGQSKQAMENAKEYERKRFSRCYHILKNILDQKDVSNQFQNDEEVLFQTRIKPYIDEILKEAQYVSCSAMKSLCERLLEVLRELKIPVMRQRVAILTDAGPGVGISNFEVKFIDAELARLWNSDYRIRLHRSRGDSGQGEAERTNSAIGDSVVNGATIDWEIVKRYEGMTAKEVEGMSLQEFEKYEAERMSKMLGLSQKS